MILFLSVPQSHVTVTTIFGKYCRTLKPGLHLRIPFEIRHSVTNWGTVANKNGYYIELAEQITDTSPKQCHSKDNVPVTIDASIYWRITDVRRALFEVDNLPRSITDSALNALRSEIGKLSLDEVLSSRRELSDSVAASLGDVAAQWGAEISRVEIQELQTSSETEDAMRMEMAAERKRRAYILESEGKALAMEKEAEANAFALRAKADADAYAIRAKADAEAYSLRIRSEAEAAYAGALSEKVTTDAAGRIIMLDKTLEAYKNIAAEPSNKVFLPSDIQTVVTDLAGEKK